MATSAYQKPSPFLALPPELRNFIYELVLPNGDIYIISEDGTKQVQPPLLSTCRQIREEALSLYYTNRTFYLAIKNNYRASVAATAWLHSLVPEKRGAHIGCLHLDICPVDVLEGEQYPGVGMSAKQNLVMIGQEVIRSGFPRGHIKVRLSPKSVQRIRDELGDGASWLQGKAEMVARQSGELVKRGMMIERGKGTES